MFLRNLAEKTRRGQSGRIEAGKSAGGRSYGYNVDRQLLADGTFTTGDLVINEAEAAVIRRIYADYIDGKSARSIAIALNKEGIPPPRSGKGKKEKNNGKWSFSTISGNWKRGTGILNNKLYVGIRVWRRQQFIKDPETGKRQARLNPVDMLQRKEVPHLRIIDDETWNAARARLEATRDNILSERQKEPGSLKIEQARRPRYLLSGLLTCGCCGSGYIMMSAKRYGCAAARNSGTCDNRKTIDRDAVEARVLNGLKTELMRPDLVREYLAAWRKEVEEAQRGLQEARQDDERRLAIVRKQLKSIVDAIAEGMFQPSMKERADELEKEKGALESRLKAVPEPKEVIIDPEIASIYAAKVENLASALNDPEARAGAADLLRGLIDKLVLTPDPEERNGHRIELHGELGAILSLCAGGLGANANARVVSAGVGQVTVVAGTGFEPVTFRL